MLVGVCMDFPYGLSINFPFVFAGVFAFVTAIRPPAEEEAEAEGKTVEAGRGGGK